MSAALPFFSGDVCPACGQALELPMITPEMLFFRASSDGAALPDVAAHLSEDALAVAFDGRIYAMPVGQWTHYLTMRRNYQRLPLDQLAA